MEKDSAWLCGESGGRSPGWSQLCGGPGGRQQLCEKTGGQRQPGGGRRQWCGGPGERGQGGEKQQGWREGSWRMSAAAGLRADGPSSGSPETGCSVAGRRRPTWPASAHHGAERNAKILKQKHNRK